MNSNHSIIKLSLLLLSLLFASLSCLASDELQFKNAWVREAPPMAKNLAAYAEIINAGNKSLTIVSINSPMFERIQMHVTTFESGMMRMTHIEKLQLAPGESILFEPGGKHFMLIRPKKPIKSGLIIPFIVKTLSGETFFVNLLVRK